MVSRRVHIEFNISRNESHSECSKVVQKFFAKLSNYLVHRLSQCNAYSSVRQFQATPSRHSCANIRPMFGPHIDLNIDWLPRTENQKADYLSKIVDADDWPKIFCRTRQVVGPSYHRPFFR